MSIVSMEPRRIPIEELKPGEFYDIQSSDESPIVFGVLLLEQLPNTRAKLMLMCSSDNARFISYDAKFVFGLNVLQVVTMPLGIVYPYHAFTHLPDKILKWPKNYEGEELITQIKEEMRRAVSEGCWVFNLPHFCEGYLQVYLSYLRWRVNIPSQEELVDLWFEFMCSFFSVVGDHILRVKLLPTELISELLKSTKFMNQLSEKTGELRESILSPWFVEKEKKLAATKKSFIDSYRPIELSAGKFDRLWELILQEYHQDWVIWQVQEPLSLRSLLLRSTKLIGILSCYSEFVRDVIDLSFPELQSEERFRIKSQIESAVYSFRLAEDLVEQSGLAAEELSRIILEKQLVSPILISRSDKLQDFVMTRPELFHAVFAYLRNSSQGKIPLHCLLKCVVARIAAKDWTFLSFLIEHRSLKCVTIQKEMNTEETCEQIKGVVGVALEYHMSANLLRDLLPCVDYGHLVFPALAERFHLPQYREMMMTYFSLNRLTSDIESAQAKDILSFFKHVTGKIALEDWQFMGFLIEDCLLSPTKWYSFLATREMRETVTELVNVALEHNMSAELLRDLLPCVDYGHLVFPTLVERFHLPNCREVMITYFRSEAWSIDIKDYRVKEIVFAYLRFVTCRIALEDWEFVALVIPDIASFSTMNLTDQTIQIKALVKASLEHKISAELLRDLLPCVDYGHFVFPAFSEMFPLPNCRAEMLTYFRPEQWYNDRNNAVSKDRVLSFFKCLVTRITLRDWEFLTFVVENPTLAPTTQHSFLNNLKMKDTIEELIGLLIEHQLSTELFRDLLPCVDYGYLVFPALAERFHFPCCREVMITYFQPQQWHSDLKNANAEDRFLWFLLCLTDRIVLKDWEFVAFVIHSALIPATEEHILDNRNIYFSLKTLVYAALQHNMSAVLLRDLLPCVDYGHLVFPTLVEKFNLPNCREVMITYFQSENCDSATQTSSAKGRLLNVWMHWILPLIPNQKISGYYYFNCLNKQKWNGYVKELVEIALEYQICVELLQGMLPCLYFGHLVFPTLAEKFHLPNCKEVMLTYFSNYWWHDGQADRNAKDRLYSYWECLHARIAVADWEFVTFVLMHSALIPDLEQVVEVHTMYNIIKSIIHSALEQKMNPELLQKLLPCAKYGELTFPAFVSEALGSFCKDTMISYFRSETRCIELAQTMLSTGFVSIYRPPRGAIKRRERKKCLVDRSKALSQYVRKEKTHLWYVFGVLVRMQFIWIRQFSPGKRLGIWLTREVCSYLV